MRKRNEITGGIRGKEKLGGEAKSNGEGIMNTEKLNRRHRERRGENMSHKWAPI
jgi:hypothetical protein